MSVFSSTPHPAPIPAADDGGVIDDPALPVAAHLTGPHAIDLLAAAVSATGASLLDCRAVQVHYRPQSDLIVRYATTCRRPDGAIVGETLLAGSTRHGIHHGTLPVEADTDTGERITAGVWRWPFDPVLSDLGRIVTPSRAQEVLGALVTPPLSIEVVVYRPCDRVVVRVVDCDGQQIYVKLVAPDAVEHLVDRHDRLRRVGVPAPEILAAGDSWVAMAAIEGPTLRDLIKADDDLRQPAHRAAWPNGQTFNSLVDRIAQADLHHVKPVRRRLADASSHAAMLASVLAGQRSRLHDLSARFQDEALASADHDRKIVHGDLHESQVIVRDGEVVGLLDIDDVGPGDPVDDMATLLAHLEYRAMTSTTRRAEIAAYRDGVRRAFLTRVDVRALDRRIAAVLVGLATGPFRIQQHGWQAAVSDVLDLVDMHLAASDSAAVTSRDETGLRNVSSGCHTTVG